MTPLQSRQPVLRLQTACPPSPAEPFLRLMNGLIPAVRISDSIIDTDSDRLSAVSMRAFLGHNAPAALHSLTVLTCGGKLRPTARYWAQVAGPATGP